MYKAKLLELLVKSLIKKLLISKKFFFDEMIKSVIKDKLLENIMGRNYICLFPSILEIFFLKVRQ